MVKRHPKPAIGVGIMHSILGTGCGQSRIPVLLHGKRLQVIGVSCRQFVCGEVHGISILRQRRTGRRVAHALLGHLATRLIIDIDNHIAHMVLEHVGALHVVIIHKAHIQPSRTIRAVFLHHGTRGHGKRQTRSEQECQELSESFHFRLLVIYLTYCFMLLVACWRHGFVHAAGISLV